MKKYFLSKEAWTFIALTLLSVCVIFSFISLNPKVDFDTFFSGDDPTLQADEKISKLFPRNDTQLLIGIIGDIHSRDYQNKLRNFGNFLKDLNDIDDVKSIVDGPKNIHRAINGPLWKRLLISNEGRASNMMVVLNPEAAFKNLPDLISKIENLKEVFEAPDFRIKISGFPYIVELMRRHLNRDLKIFTTLAFIIFGLVVLIIFNSWRIVLGMLVTCFNAACLTIIINQFVDIPIGILTANLTTIIFVLTLSHIIFLTFNWKHTLHLKDRELCTQEAVRVTGPASFWAMLTTLLGFISLLNVSAKPIRDLGISGAIGTVLAFCLAYTIFPVFLRLQQPEITKADRAIQRYSGALFQVFNKMRWLIVLGIAGIIMLTLPFLKTINLDPSLISFFSPKSEIAQGLKYIDEQGGSNPLVVVLRDPQNIAFHKSKNIKRLMDLHYDIEENKNVGNVISLPLLIKEVRGASFLSIFLTNKYILQVMDRPEFGNVSSGFVTHDYDNTMFLLRMNESDRVKKRITVMRDLKQTIENHGFTAHLMGGIYSLQGHLSQLVSSSLIFGLTRLILIFAVIALLASLSLRVALAMTLSICVIPLCILGPIGLLNIPLDIVTAPAANIAISIGIDAMIHMTHFYRRLVKSHSEEGPLWPIVREKMWQPVMTSMLIVCCGFGIFFFSSFPPTQRFGGSIVWGTIIAAMTALFIFTMLAGEKKQKKSQTQLTKKRVKDIPEAPSPHLPGHNWN